MIALILNTLAHWLFELIVTGFIAFFYHTVPAIVYVFLFLSWYLVNLVLCFLSLPWYIADAYRYCCTPPPPPGPVKHQPPPPTIHFPLPSEPVAIPLWPVPTSSVHWSPAPAPVQIVYAKPFNMAEWQYEGYLLARFEANLLNRGPLAGKLSRSTPAAAPVFAAPVPAAPNFVAPVRAAPVLVAPRAPAQNNPVLATAQQPPVVRLSTTDDIKQRIRAAGQQLRSALSTIASAKTNGTNLYQYRVEFDKQVLRPHLANLRSLADKVKDKEQLRAGIEWPLDEFKPLYNDIEDEELDAPLPDEFKQLMLLMEEVYKLVGLSF
ncbi:hypothetical protein BDV96DRAFT_598498 [Lophiotrema nucula]|uniref:Uncharacterized protein n=1 Tax=Lophiotrema nucula TaxID=690887 RepID=A0A6A5ZBK3_9PLEO|nr:hypothetical protein BDV96DRAFT_598498 [Lophiotrema nucula]